MKKPPNDGRFLLNKGLFMDEAAKVLTLILGVLRWTLWLIKKLRKLG
jgi:hypothetical protein